MRLVREHRLAVDDHQPVMPCPKAGRSHDLVLPPDRARTGIGSWRVLSGLVDLGASYGTRSASVSAMRSRSVSRLCSDKMKMVKDLRQPPVRLDERIRLSRAAGVRPRGRADVRQRRSPYRHCVLLDKEISLGRHHELAR